MSILFLRVSFFVWMCIQIDLVVAAQVLIYNVNKNKLFID